MGIDIIAKTWLKCYLVTDARFVRGLYHDGSKTKLLSMQTKLEVENFRAEVNRAAYFVKILRYWPLKVTVIAKDLSPS